MIKNDHPQGKGRKRDEPKIDNPNPNPLTLTLTHSPPPLVRSLPRGPSLPSKFRISREFRIFITSRKRARTIINHA